MRLACDCTWLLWIDDVDAGVVVAADANNFGKELLKVLSANIFHWLLVPILSYWQISDGPMLI